jgi:hypothetical protein
VLPYVLPSWIAQRKRAADYWPIFYINLFHGWTFIGWIAAFARAINV